MIIRLPASHCPRHRVHPIPFSSVQSLSRVQLLVTPSTAACQASLSITNSWSLLKPMSIESVMPSSHLILSSPSPPAFNRSQHQGLFKWVSSYIRWPKYWSFSFSISPCNESLCMDVSIRKARGKVRHITYKY